MRSFLRVLQLASPALPIGAYAYSHGLEQAVVRGWVHDAESAERWIHGVLTCAIGRLDVPALAKLHLALSTGDHPAAARWDRFLRASRETAELALEDRQLALALSRILEDQGVEGAAALRAGQHAFPAVFALAAVAWSIGLDDCLGAFCFMFVEGQVAAALKLVPLGQSAGQRILSRAIEWIAAVVSDAKSLPDHDIGLFAPGLALASALHETQYARLFRS